MQLPFVLPPRAQDIVNGDLSRLSGFPARRGAPCACQNAGAWLLGDECVCGEEVRRLFDADTHETFHWESVCTNFAIQARSTFEPDEDWFYDYERDEFLEGPELAAPHHHPVDQPVPGPGGRVPDGWEDQLN